MDRKKIIDKHSPHITEIAPDAPLSLGNGDFGMSVDFTGLQSFPESYRAPLSTQSNWGWHSTGGRKKYSLEDTPMQTYSDTPYPLFPEDKEESYHWLRQNPHRLQLGQLGFVFFDDKGAEVSLDDVKPIKQQLLLWSGKMISEFMVDAHHVKVETACDPNEDTIAVSVISSIEFAVQIAFPNPNMTDRVWEKSKDLTWERAGHETKIEKHTSDYALLKRSMDDTSYYVRFDWKDSRIEQVKEHVVRVTPTKDAFSFTVSFSEQVPESSKIDEVMERSEMYWHTFWSEGGFLSFEGSKDTRADELERRVILSQYLLAIHSGGSIPPQETGFMYNSWFGKFHLEMHWWHASHFPLWGRAHMLEKSMQWYLKIFPEAYNLAKSQGFNGVRWPKMVAHTGDQTPSPIAPGLIWQQPHPIALAELCYQANPSLEILNIYREIVFATADFMTSFASYDEESDTYNLGPGLIPSQENHQMEESMNPPYELEYWDYGLGVAIEWCERLGERVPEEWRYVKNKLAKPTHVDGVYLAHKNSLNTFTEKNDDHPSMVAALGVLPGNLVDREIMLRTLMKIKKEWKWETAWGWDFPMCAMTAARLGESELAVDFLLMDEVKNTYLVNGHNYQNESLTSYLPGNGGLLTTVAMMATKWGFPAGWKVAYQDLEPLLK